MGNRMHILSKTRQFIVTFIGLAQLLFMSTANAAWDLNMPIGVTTTSKQVYDLHMVIFWICVWIGVAVFGVLIFSLIFHRKSRGAVAATFHEHTPLEVLWAIIPFLLLVVMAVPATKVVLAMYDTDESALTIKITGYQWKWKYEYLDQGISMFSNLATTTAQILGEEKKNPWYLLEVDNELVVPINKKIRFLVTSNDTLHSWWVPDFAIKRDAIPGFIHEAWAVIDKPGVYRGQCAELCGVGHAYMPIVVRAVTESEFDKWVSEHNPSVTKIQNQTTQAWDAKKLMSSGKVVYEKYCAACHGLEGLGQPPIFPPMKGSSVAVGKPISRHINTILYGIKGTAMQRFADQLTDEEIAAVVTYERNAFGNRTGDTVQAADVTVLRNKEASNENQHPLSVGDTGLKQAVVGE